MIEIKGKNADELFVNIANKMLDVGEYSSPRGLKTLELEDAFLILEDPHDSVVNLKSRNINYNYLNGEMEWYSHGGYDSDEIVKYSKFWLKLRNDDNTVNSNYGQIALRDMFNGDTQYNWCYNKLKDDPDTRQAIINYNQPRHKYEGNLDFVCTISSFFRNKNGKLSSTTLMRSNDLIKGLSYDLPWFTHIQKQMANDLNLDVGQYKHYMHSLHVYEKDFKMLSNIANDKYGEGK